MHGTVEWLPGQPLGNDRKSWSDELLGSLPNIYIYAANNPSGKFTIMSNAKILLFLKLILAVTESILAKRRGYGTLVSYNVPPYGRAGLYLTLANLKELVDDYRMNNRNENIDTSLCQSIYDTAQHSGMVNDVPFHRNMSNSTSDVGINVDVWNSDEFEDWIKRLSDYLNVLQDRLFSSGLR
jgi:magnesium chelatase subunit H